MEAVQADDFLAAVLAPCVSKTLKCNDAATAQILEANLHWRESALDAEEDLLHILQSTEIKEQFSKDDAQAVEDALKESESRNRERQGIVRKIRRLRGSGADAGHKTGMKRKPVAYEPDREYSTEGVDALLPSGYRSYKDTYNGCWRIFARKGKFSISRSWGYSGSESKCIHKLGPIVWARYCELHPESACPFQFEGEAEPPKASKAPKASAKSAAASDRQ